MSASETSPPNALVKVRGLTKAFGTNQVLMGVDLDVQKGSVVSIIGASGSGKTTLLRCVDLLETYDDGSKITSALDPELVGEVLKVVHSLARDGMTMILVTHEMSFARDVSSQVVFMDGGRVAVRGTPQDVFGARAQHERLRSFLARIELKDV